MIEKIIDSFFAFLDFLIEMSGFIILLVLLVALVMWGINSLEARSCRNYQEMTGKNTKHISFDSCYIETESGWQSWEEYKARILASEARTK